VLIGHSEQHIQTSGHWLEFSLKISDAREGNRGRRRAIERERKKERKGEGKRKKWGSRGVISARWISASTRTRQNERPYVLRTVGISLRLDESERASEPCCAVLWFPTTFHADESVSRYDSAGYSWRERRQRVAFPALCLLAQNKARSRIHARSLNRTISAKLDSPSDAPFSSLLIRQTRFYACSDTTISQIIREVVENYRLGLVPALDLSYNRHDLLAIYLRLSLFLSLSVY